MSLIRYTQSGERHDNGKWDAVPIEGYPWLYVGSLSAAESLEQLRAHNVTAVLTVARNLFMNLDSMKNNNINHLIVEIDDHPQANFLSVASQCWDFINKAEESRSCLLVHCASGISRSVTAIVSWLMIYHDSTLDDAITKVRKNRPLAKPNAGFTLQMETLSRHNGDIEKSINDWKSMNTSKLLYEATEKRRLANQIHSDVDDLEIQIQQLKSSIVNQDECTIKVEERKSQLLKQATHISDTLDRLSGSPSLHLPEERVTKMISKSARLKLEGLILIIDSLESRQL